MAARAPHHADAAALVGWAIGLRWAAAAADAFLNAATAAAVAVAADGANAEATGWPVTAAEAATLRLLGACLAGPDALRSTGAGGGSSPRLLCALSAAEEARHRALAAGLHARLAAHGPPTAEWAAAADEACPLCAAPVPWAFHAGPSSGPSSSSFGRGSAVPWGFAVCRSGHKLDRCARRLTLLDPFEGDEEDEDEEGKDEDDDEGGVGKELWRCGGCHRAALAEPVSAASASSSSSSSSWSLSRRPFAWLATAAAAFAEHEAEHAGTAAAARPSCAARSHPFARSAVASVLRACFLCA